jgi:integrase
VTAEPQRTAIITCMCLGVRREEVWALMWWSDFDFVNNTVMIQRSIVGGKVFPTVKTDAREAPLPLDPDLVTLLLRWRSTSQFSKDSDWVWASPFSAGDAAVFECHPAGLHHSGGDQGWRESDGIASATLIGHG